MIPYFLQAEALLRAEIHSITKNEDKTEKCLKLIIEKLEHDYLSADVSDVCSILKHGGWSDFMLESHMKKLTALMWQHMGVPFVKEFLDVHR